MTGTTTLGVSQGWKRYECAPWAALQAQMDRTDAIK